MKRDYFQGGSWGLLSLLLASLLMLWGGVWGLWLCAVEPLGHAWASRHWVATPAVLDEVWIQGTGGVWRPPIREGKIDPAARLAEMPYGQVSLQVSYHYTFGDQVFESSDYGLHRGLSDGDRVRQAASLMYRRQAVTAWVNPNDPREALLDRQLYWEILLFSVPAAGMALFGLMIAWASLLAIWPGLTHKIRWPRV